MAPAEKRRTQRLRHPAAGSAGKCVVRQRGEQDSEDDGNGLAESGSQHDGQELRFVAHLAERDDAGRDEKRLNQEGYPGAGQTEDRTSPPALPVVVRSMVLPGVGAARAMVDEDQVC